MVSSSKVLTVSYGTFSCTLEGFDDSFGTMKAIAEYFRDLASNDRYFGAEPPTPDAEMLARIAEREVSRRVEAHSDGGNIVLRTDPPAEQSQDIETAPIAEKPALDTPAIKVAATETVEVAEAPIKTEAPSPAVQDAPAKVEDVIEAETLVEEPVAAPVLAKAAPEAPTEEADSASIAAKLRRIRAVVGKPSESEAAPDYDEDEHADDLINETVTETELDDFDAPDPIKASAAPEAQKDNDAGILDGVKAAIATTGAAAVAGTVLKAATDDDKQSVGAITQEELHAQDFDVTEPSIEIDEVSLKAEAPKVDVDLPEIEAPRTEQTASPIPEDAAVEIPAQPANPVRARVIKMKRAEFEEAISKGAIEEDTSAEELLSNEDELELQRELAQVESELYGTPEVSIEDGAEQTIDPLDGDDTTNLFNEDEQARKGFDTETEEDLDRLMTVASTQLEEPETKNRRDAIGHMRAAVSAARADKALAPNDGGDDTEAYREDLTTAVRPSRPVRRLSAQHAPGTPRAVAAPLKLVAEQRVDVPDADTPAKPVRPVRPRRVNAAETEPTPASNEFGEGTFAEFAEEMGASHLPDLLEAAAAYLAFIEGRDQFSRPQVMTKVREIKQENFSREDGLRTFGQLLREGKIEKISGGRFTVSDQISFKPDTRAAG